jgi:hypothetical protein
MASKKVFISHTSGDAALANALQDLLTRGTKLSPGRVFNSDRDGNGVPTGEDFVGHIRQVLNETAFAILLISPAYFASTFCMWELGALWTSEPPVPVFPILVGDADESQLKGPLTNRVARRLNRAGLNTLHDELNQRLNVRAAAGDWEQSRDAFLTDLASLLTEARLQYRSVPYMAPVMADRLVNKLSRVHRAFHILRDIATEHLGRPRGVDLPDPHSFRHLIRDLESSLDAMREAFEAFTGAECRFCLKTLLIPNDILSSTDEESAVSDEVLRVTDLVRSKNVTLRRSPAPSDQVDKNTDFKEIMQGGQNFYLCNDIPDAYARGEYENSHGPPESLWYRSTVVWPLRTRLPNSSFKSQHVWTPSEYQHVIGFLCVDSDELNAFPGGLDQNDPDLCIALGAAYADTLFQTLHPFWDDFSDLFYADPGKSLADQLAAPRRRTAQGVATGSGTSEAGTRSASPRKRTRSGAGSSATRTGATGKKSSSKAASSVRKRTSST